MNKLKKIMGIVLVLAIVSSIAVVFAGCNPIVLDPEDEGKFQLKISAYEAGYGTEWLINYKTAFEQAYADYTHPDYPEKEGVQISIDWNQNASTEILAKLALDTIENHLYFNSVNPYDLAASGDAYNLTSILQADMAEVGETGKTLEGKIETDYQNYLKAFDGKYYAMPMFETYEGLQYNIDLFERKGFYFVKDSVYYEAGPTPEEQRAYAESRFTTGLSGAKEKAEGPDGVANTLDDGLPATHAEFWELCDYMVASSVTPFVWSGVWKNYANMLPKALWINEEGIEQMRLHFTFNGQAKTLVDVDEDGNVTPYNGGEPVTINDNNAYLLQKQEGLYRALQFAKKMTSNPDYYDSESLGGTLTHTGAQDKFITNELLGGKPIAFLPEGTYWQAEAVGTFNANAQQYGDVYGYEQNRYGFMPLPTYDGKVGHKNTIMSGANICFADGQISGYEVELVQSFLQFISTDAQLYEFLKLTHYSRAMKMTLNSDQYNSLSSYAKSMYNVRSNSDIVYTFSENQFFLYYSGTSFSWSMNRDGWIFNYSSTYQLPIQDMKNDTSGTLTPEEYFNGCYSRLQAKWDQLYTDYWYPAT